MRRGVPSLSTLQAFEAAARHESFSKAALELSQTHGAVCKKVNELELQLGIALFERVRHRLVLSAAGRNMPGASACIWTRSAATRRSW